MSETIEALLAPYLMEKRYGRKEYAMHEVLQEVVLSCLSRTGFFRQCALYGGCALRIFHGSGRFSEDLDFALENKESSFDFSAFLPLLEKEVRSFGLHVTAEENYGDDTGQSALLQGNTKEYRLLFSTSPAGTGKAGSGDGISMKLKTDTDPPEHATLVHDYRLYPAPYEVMLYDLPSVFAGTIHAILCQEWKQGTMGRVLYDYQCCIALRARVNLQHLGACLAASHRSVPGGHCSLRDIRQMLDERFDAIDYSAAKEDVRHLLHDPSLIDLWCADFFTQITELQEARLQKSPARPLAGHL